MVIHSALIPISRAASLFWAVARTDLPMSVFNRKKNSAAVSSHGNPEGDDHGHVEGNGPKVKRRGAVAGLDGLVVGMENEPHDFRQHHADAHRHQDLVFRKNGVHLEQGIEEILLDQGPDNEKAGMAIRSEK